MILSASTSRGIPTGANETNYDLISVVIVCLGEKSSDRYSGLLKILDVLLAKDISSADKKKILQDEFKIPMTQKLEGDVNSMCNLSEGVYTSGYNIGFDNGFNNGFDNGFDSAVISDIIKLQKAANWDIDRCMSVLEVPIEKQASYKKAIEEKTVMA